MDVLDEILAGVREDLAERLARTPLDTLRERAARRLTDVRSALRGDAGVRLIAEVKRSSPSAGRLAEVSDPAALAAAYEAGGAAAISVLTERRRFHGSLEDLAQVRGRVGVPVLCKDFLLTPYQVWEARAYGADLVLLIVAALPQPELVELVAEARAAGLTPLVEAHDREEVARAVDAGADVIGINARSLRTLEVDRMLFPRLAGHIPDGVVRIAESGVRGPEDVAVYAAAGADAVLVGTSLVTARRPADAVRLLMPTP
jgi:indole-3-glycerol phosphate synthase